MFKFSETNHVHKIFLPTTSALLMIYGEVGQGVKLLRRGGEGKKAGSGNIPVSYTHLTLPTNREV